MVKRFNKITSLLVAAAAIVSIVPATGANASVRLGNKAGTIKEGIAFDGGKYSYYGYKSDSDLTGVYFNNGTDAKEALNGDLEDYRFGTLSKYGTKYAYAYEQSNDDEYLVDLSTGKIVDDATKEEKADLAQANLKAKIKKAERYNSGTLLSFNQILQGQFGEVWYKYSTEGDQVASTNVVTSDAKGTILGFTLPTEETVKAEVRAYEVAKLDGTTGTLPTYKVGNKTYTYANGATGVVDGFNNFADLVTLAQAQVSSELYPAVQTIMYNKTLAPTTTTGAGTTTTTTVTQATALFDGTVSVVGNIVGLQADAAGNLENISGLSKASIGTIKDTAIQYKAELTLGADAETNTTTSLQQIYGFANEDGKYIDASYTANIKVYSKTKGRAVLVEKFGEENKDAGLKVDLVSIDAIAQDKDYIYTVTKVKVTGSVAENQIFIQKISKAQGTKDADGAYVPKTVKSYQVNNGIYDNGDATDALGLFDGTNTEFQYLLGMSVKDGNIYVTRAKEDQVKVYKVTLKDSVKSDVLANGATLKTDVDSALALSNEDDDNVKEDITSFDVSTAADDAGLQGITAVKSANDTEDVQLNGETLYRHPSVSIDVNGNTWALKKGKVTKFDGITKKSDIYTVDGAMSAIDVYDDENLIAWDVDGDIYTNVAEGKVVTGKEADAVKPPVETPAEQVKTGWDKQADGSWKLFGTDGKELTGWQKVGGVWYYMDPASKLMKTGWVNDNGTWYFLQSSGAMKTGWVNDNGTWYFLQSSGAMKTGWLNDNGTWYFLNSSGAMLSNTVVGGYKLGASGAWVK